MMIFLNLLEIVLVGKVVGDGPKMNTLTARQFGPRAITPLLVSERRTNEKQSQIVDERSTEPSRKRGSRNNTKQV